MPRFDLPEHIGGLIIRTRNPGNDYAVRPASKMDSFDRPILMALQSEGRMQNKELADKIGLYPSPCLRRTSALEEQGIIEGYAAVVPPEKVAFSPLSCSPVSV